MTMTPRQHDILSAVREAGRVTVDGLAERFGVTVQTIRRDLGALCDAGVLDRTHGGAMLPSGVTNIGYEARRQVAAEAKEAIGRAAAALVPPGASLFLNIGTTTEAVARALMGTPNLMVVTNNMNVAQILAAHPSAEIIVTGGRLRRSDGGLVGDMAVQTIRQFKVDIAIVGGSALDADGDLLDFDADEVRVARAILDQARSAMLVADATKLTRSAPVRIAGLADLDRWITDQAPGAGLERLAAEAGTQITIAG
ncbi:DeoR/GlpR family DNA-binding transcription regulator [Roseibacterium sp. SDUM158016]|jgi:DeoR family glycerol-3-phosphate regulon repressor|uniref:DeoR/GlpR family DNA-binding transcription regulator n=1 Tax=Roseicyclus sediminis TaxID=2980997 RepID=UPI0021D1BCDD|nr:DeoR/GlpR family DNA-binding transcription regulator [Roseibacterium sp. SDUM158016]MCU4653026.1 DeoR/GlpR family DNA-binding transcription regulator [Roseibacterium sp. SDUM158016]